MYERILTMTCLKCNSEIPDGAKFCPVCGASCGSVPDVKPAAEPAASEKKYFCEKCGLELERGARFCAVCGAPAANVGDIRPISNDGMSAVSLEKRTSASDSLVSAMNSVGASAPSSVPTPSNGQSAGFSSGFGGTGMGYAADVSGMNAGASSPAYPAPTNVPTFDNPFDGMGAAAAAVTPIKKKGGAKVGIIIAAVVVVLIAAAAVFFLTNKATVLSMVMGKSGYAAMVEGKSVKEMTEKLDPPVLANGIKSGSNVFAALASMDDSYGFITSMDGPSSRPEDVDFKAMLEAYNQLMLDAYGVNSVDVTASAEVSISEAVRAMIGMQTSEIDDIIKTINETTLTYNVSSSKNALSAGFGINSGSVSVDAKTLVTDNGEIYLVFPFYNANKAVMFKMETGTGVPTPEVKPLELDEKEISRLIGDIVEIYIKHYKDSVVSMESGELSAAGLVAKGKLITAEIGGEKLDAFFAEIGELIANDKYFRDKIIAFVNDNGGNITEAEYKAAITDAFTTYSDPNDKIIVNTVTDNAGNVLAKSFAISDDAMGTIATLVYLDSKDCTAVEVEITEDDIIASVVNKRTSGKDGSYTFKYSQNDSGSVTVTVEYSGVEKKKFGNSEVYVGTYTLGYVLPADFTSGTAGAWAMAVPDITVTFSSDVEGQNTMKTSASLDVASYGSVKINLTATAKNDSSALTAPSDTIDMTAIVNGGRDSAVEQQLEDYFEGLYEKIEGMLDEDFVDWFEGAIEEAMGGIGGLADHVDSTRYTQLKNSIISSSAEISEYMFQYNKISDELLSRIDDLQAEYVALLKKISADMSQSEYATCAAMFDTLELQKEVLKAALKAADDPNITPVYDFDMMDDYEILDVLYDYEDYFIGIYNNQMDLILSDTNLTDLCSTAYDAYDKVCDAANEYFYNTADDGRKLRATSKAFVEAVDALGNALEPFTAMGSAN